MSERIFIVADDLTGACDSAAAFVASGRTVRVFLNATKRDAIIGDTAEVIAVTTESRDLAPDDAARCVAEVFESLRLSSARALLFKKIDSVARGPFAAEIEAAFGASHAALALVTPAFPAAGRTVRGGVLTVHGSSGGEAEIVLRDLFERAQGLRILPALPPVSPQDPILHAIKDRVRILLCDAIEQEDLNRLAAAALPISERILWVGSAGLARALAAQLQVDGSLPGSGNSMAKRQSGRTLLFTGTPHPVTALQLEHLELVSGKNRPSRRAICKVPETGASSEVVISAFTTTRPAGLILTGGDTAAYVLRALNACAILLAGELDPGIPWGIVEGGLADGCTVITKSGGFGERDALVRAFEFCESEFCEFEV